MDICIFLQKCFFSSPLRFIRLLSKSVNLIGCRGGKKGNHKGDEAETWHTCLGHWLLYKLCFLFLSDKNSGCYGNL